MAEDDMKSGMMSLLKTMLPEEEPPKNVVAKFIQAELVKILDESDEAGVLGAIFVDVANKHPKDVLKSLIEVYNDIGIFVTNLTEISVSGDHEDLEEPDFEVIDDTKEIEEGDGTSFEETEAADENERDRLASMPLSDGPQDLEDEPEDIEDDELGPDPEPETDDGPEEFVTIRRVDLDKYKKQK